MCLGTDYYGSRTPPEMAFKLLDEFADAGGTFLDTANVYAAFLPGFQGGESESVIGDWMVSRGHRSRMFVASKVAGQYQDVAGGLRAADIRRECDRSLRRLRSDVIDLYYAHVDDRETPLDEILEAFHDLVMAGKVRYIGLSNWQLWRLAEARLLAELRGWSPLAAVQLRHTYLRPAAGAGFGHQIAATAELMEFARCNDVTVVAYSVLLNGAYTRSDRNLPWQYQGADSAARVAALHQVAEEVDATPNQVVIAHMLHTDPTIIPIIGGSRPEQIRENTRSSVVQLSSEQLHRLNEAGSPRPSTLTGDEP